jgi:hypothetical protein
MPTFGLFWNLPAEPVSETLQRSYLGVPLGPFCGLGTLNIPFCGLGTLNIRDRFGYGLGHSTLVCVDWGHSTLVWTGTLNILGGLVWTGDTQHSVLWTGDTQHSVLCGLGTLNIRDRFGYGLGHSTSLED